MALTPDDIANKGFQLTKFREGYDQDEVDDFLDEINKDYTQLIQENEAMRAKLEACERRVGELSRASVARDVEVAPAAALAPAMPAPMAAPTPAALLGQSEGQGPEAAAGMLQLAQKLHDEYVRNGEQQRDRIVGEAREHANRLMREAEEKQRQTLGSLEQERSLLERKIDELRAFEREYRSRLKSYLEGQLRELETKAAVVPNRGNNAASPASSNGSAAFASNGQNAPGLESSTTAEPAAASSQFPFGGAS